MIQDRKTYDKFMRDGKKPRCQERVSDAGGWRWYQCRRSAKVGEYCKQHDPVAVAEKAKARKVKSDIEWLETRKKIAGPRWHDVLRLIANGHNDPRTLAVEALHGFDDD